MARSIQDRRSNLLIRRFACLARTGNQRYVDHVIALVGATAARSARGGAK